jgi:serine/threonine protein kinase
MAYLAKHFIHKLLVKDPKQRYTAEEALKHPWLNPQKGGQTRKLKLSPSFRELTKEHKTKK